MNSEEHQIGIPLIGDKFPTMQATTTHGPITLPDDMMKDGKWFVLFSHPADFTQYVPLNSMPLLSEMINLRG